MYTLMDYLTQCSNDYRGDPVDHFSTIQEARKRMREIAQSWIVKSGFVIREQTKDDVVLQRDGVRVYDGSIKTRYYHLWIVRSNSNLD